MGSEGNFGESQAQKSPQFGDIFISESHLESRD